MTELRKIKYAYSLLSVCLVGVGAVLFICPSIAVETIYRLGGIVLILLGIVKLTGYFSKDDLFQLAFQFDFALGVIFGVVGIFLLFQTKRMMEIVAVCIGVIMLIDGLLRIQTTMDAKRFGIQKWWILLLISLVAVVIGILLLIMPFKGTKVIIRLVGLNLCISGILNLVIVQSTVKTRRNKKWQI